MGTRIKKGDRVIVVSGSREIRGQQGKVLEVLLSKKRVIIEKVNIVKRHTKPTQTNQAGGIIEKEAPVHLSNVMLVDPSDGKPCRVGVKTLEDGRKVRYSKRSGETFN